MTVLCDPRYSLLYHLHRHLETPADSYSVADFYQFQWKRTDKLYELWGFLQFIKALSSLGWEMEEGMSVIREDGRYRLSSLESGAVISMKKGEEEIRLTYDGIIPAASADTDRMTAPLYTNNAHRQPDLRMDCYRGRCTAALWSSTSSTATCSSYGTMKTAARACAASSTATVI